MVRNLRVYLISFFRFSLVGLTVLLMVPGPLLAQSEIFSIQQIMGEDYSPQTTPTDKELREILSLYVGKWNGSIDLTDKFGTVIQTLAVKKEYRMDKVAGKDVLVGRFEFGKGAETKYSSSETEAARGFLINRVNQEGKNIVYKGTIDDGRIAWREYGVPRGEYNVFYETFDERNGRRISTSTSRNQVRNRDGTEETYFTAGRFRYAGPPGDSSEDWSLPEPTFQTNVPAAPRAAPQAAPTTGSGASGAVITEPDPTMVQENINLRNQIESLQEYQSQSVQLAQERDALRTQLTTTEADLTAERARMQELSGQVDDLMERLAAAQAQSEALATTTNSPDDELRKSLAVAQSRAAVLEAKVTATEQERANLMAQMQASETQLVQLQEHLSSRDSTIEEIRQELDATRQTIQTAGADSGRVAELEQQLAESRQDMARLQSELALQASTITQTKGSINELALLNEQLDGQQKDIKALTNRSVSLEGQLYQSQDRIKQLEDDLYNKEEEVISLQAQLEIKQNTLDNTRNQLDDLGISTDSEEEYQERISQLELALTEARNSIGQMREDARERAGEILLLRDKLLEFGDADERMERQKERLIQFQNDMLALQEQLKTNTEERETLQQTLDERKSDINSLRGELEQSTSDHAQTKAQLAAIREDRDTDIARKQEEVVGVQAKLNDAENRIAALQEQLIKQEEALITDTSRSGQLEAMADQLQLRERQLAEQQEQITNQQREIRRWQDQVIALEEQVATASTSGSELEALRVQLETESAAAAAARSTVVALEAQLANQPAAPEGVVLSDEQAAEYQALQQQVNTLTAELEQSRSNLAELEAKLAAERTQAASLAEKEAVLASRDDEVSRLRSRIDELAREAGVAEAYRLRIEELENEQRALNERLREARAENQTLFSGLADAGNESLEMVARLTEIEETKTELTARLAESVETNARLSDELANMTASFEGLSRSNQALLADNETLKAQLETSQTENTDLQTRIATITSENTQLVTQLQSLEGKSETFSTQIAALEASNAKLTTELNDTRQQLIASSEIQAELEAKSAELTTLQASYDQLSSQLAEAREQIAVIPELRAQIAAQDEQITGMETVVADFKSQLAEAGLALEEVKTMRDDLASRDARLAALQSDLDGIANERDELLRLKDDYVLQEEKIIELQTELAQAETLVSQREVQVVTLREELDAATIVPSAAAVARIENVPAAPAAGSGEVDLFEGITEETLSTMPRQRANEPVLTAADTAGDGSRRILYRRPATAPATVQAPVSRQPAVGATRIVITPPVPAGEPPVRLSASAVPTVTPAGGSAAIPSSTRTRPARDWDYKNHRVEPGQSLSVICRDYGASIWEVMRLNQISDPRNIKPGQILLIRVPTS